MSFDPWALFIGIVVSSVGLGLFVYGKKEARVPQLAVGAALLVTPYLIAGSRSLLLTASALLLALWWALRLGW